MLEAATSALLVIASMFAPGFGLPLGMPPAEMDPLTLRVAPEECLYYVAWAGTAEPDAESGNHTERLLAEPEVRHFIDQFDLRLRRQMTRVGRDAETPQGRAAAQFYPAWMRLLMTRPAAIYVSKWESQPDAPPRVQGGAIIHAGEKTEAAARVLRSMQELYFPGEFKAVDIAGVTFQRIETDDGIPPMLWGVKGKYLIFGLGDDSIDELFANAVTPPPAWLRQMREELPVDRPATLTYADLRHTPQHVIDVQHTMMVVPRRRIDRGRAERLIDTLGLRGLTTFRSVTGLEGDGLVTRTRIGIDDSVAGLAALAAAEPLTAEHLATIPADAQAAIAVRLDSRQVLELFGRASMALDARSDREFDDIIQRLDDDLGTDFENDLFAGLGDVWSVFHSPGESGSIFTGATAMVTVRDHAKVKRSFDTLMEIAVEQFDLDEEELRGLGRWALRNRPLLKSMQVGDETIHYMWPGNEAPLSPAWCLTETHLIAALHPQSIAAVLTRDESFRSLADQANVAAAFKEDGGPLLVTHFDTASVFKSYYPLLLATVQSALWELAPRDGEQAEFDISFMPSLSALLPHLQPSLGVLRRTKDGLHLEYRQSLPGGNAATSVPILAALALPATGAAQQSALWAESANNLRQIGMALHSYQTAFGKLPPRALKTKDGKPGLSWRVALLPMLEHQALYDKFRLDEPWDSEHNLPLSMTAVEVFQRPGSTTEPHMTSYLTPMHKDAVLQGVGKENAASFDDVRDGLSKTLLLVEVNDKHAVPWAKPDDWEVDKMAGTAAMKGVSPDNKFWAEFADGHIERLPIDMDPKQLLLLIQRDDGEVIDFDRLRGRAEDDLPIELRGLPLSVTDLEELAR